MEVAIDNGKVVGRQQQGNSGKDGSQQWQEQVVTEGGCV
jgi:hypothetical protein